MTIQLRIPTSSDAPALSALVTRNRYHFRSGEPLPPEGFYSVEGQSRVISQAHHTADAGTGHMFLIEEDGVLVGRASLSSVIRGAFQSASVGYAVDESRSGRGVATAALLALVDIAFDELRLHRLQGETLIENRASQTVLERCGFSRYGTAQNYLKINGQWRDNHLYQLINNDWSD